MEENKPQEKMPHKAKMPAAVFSVLVIVFCAFVSAVFISGEQIIFTVKDLFFLAAKAIGYFIFSLLHILILVILVGEFYYEYVIKLIPIFVDNHNNKKIIKILKWLLLLIIIFLLIAFFYMIIANKFLILKK